MSAISFSCSASANPIISPPRPASIIAFTSPTCSRPTFRSQCCVFSKVEASFSGATNGPTFPSSP